MTVLLIFQQTNSALGARMFTQSLHFHVTHSFRLSPECFVLLNVRCNIKINRSQEIYLCFLLLHLPVIRLTSLIIESVWVDSDAIVLMAQSKHNRCSS